MLRLTNDSYGHLNLAHVLLPAEVEAFRLRY